MIKISNKELTKTRNQSGKNNPSYKFIDESILKSKYLVEKKSCRQIAKELNSGTSTIIRKLIIAKVKIRGRSFYSTKERNPFWKGGKPKCSVCGIEIKHYSKTCNEHKGMKGSSNPAFIHGQALRQYPNIFNKELKAEIRERDGNICQSCGLTNKKHINKYGYELVIHHIDYNKDNCSKTNLISTCLVCNGKANHNIAYWMELFKKKIENIYKRITGNI